MPYRIDRGVEIPREKLHPNPWNPNHMKPRQQSAVAESVETYGQVLELLVRPHPDISGEYQVIDGEHRLNILPEIAFCNVIHGLPDADAKKLTIVMNETRGSADKVELAQLLADLNSEMDNLVNALPYSQAELDELIELAKVDWDQFNQDFDPGTPEDQDDDPTEGDAVKFFFALPKDKADVFTQARAMVEEDLTLDPNKDLALGQVILELAQAYLG